MLKEIGCGFVQPRGLIVLHSKEGNSYPIFRKSGISNIMCCSRLFHVLAMKAAEYRVRNKENKFGEKAIPKPLKTTRWTKTGLEATANIIGRRWVCLTNYRTVNVFPTVHWLFSNRDVCLWNMKVEAWILCLFFLLSHLFLREKRLLFEFETRLAFLARFIIIIFLVHN